MLDKIRLYLKGELPEEYQPNFGLAVGLDGQCCGFLGVTHEQVIEKVREGWSDEDVFAWCCDAGLNPSKVQKRVWNEYARKLGWNDAISRYREAQKAESGWAERPDLETMFDVIDAQEGRG